MRKKAVNQVYEVLKAVYELEKELKVAQFISTSPIPKNVRSI